MDLSQAQSSRKVYALTLRSHRAFESGLPPYPLAKLLLIVEIRTQEQGLTDRPAMRREFSITGLLKPDFIDLPTDRIRAPHISFDSFCRKVEKACNIKFDAARDELGWVQEPLGPGDKQQYLSISSELLFQNALGMMRLSTTQSELPQALVLHLWSPAPRQSIFRRSRRAPDPERRAVGDDLEPEARLQQPSGSTMPPIIDPILDEAAKEASSQKSPGSTTPPAIAPVLNQSGKEKTPLFIDPVFDQSALETTPTKSLGSTTPPVSDSVLNRIRGADDDVELTSSTPPPASQSKDSGSVQESTRGATAADLDLHKQL